jgi:hypothetical protein
LDVIGTPEIFDRERFGDFTAFSKEQIASSRNQFAAGNFQLRAAMGYPSLFGVSVALGVEPA